MKHLLSILLLLAMTPISFGATAVSTGGSADAKYIVQTADGSLANAQALSALSTGLVKVTTTTGVLSTAAAGTDYVGFNGALGTPSSGTLTSCTGLPIAGTTGYGTGIATVLATPSSANLAAACTDETGSGLLVFATSPTFTTGMTITGGTVAANSPVISATETWNNSGVTFTGIKLNVTNSASGGASLLQDLQVGGSSVFNIATNGAVSSLNTFQTYSSTRLATQLGGNGFCLPYEYPIKWNSVASTSGALFANGSFETEFLHGTKTLTESTATSLVRVTVGSGSTAGGTLHYVINADDGTDFQERSGTVNFAIVNKAGSLTAAVGTVASEAVAVSSGTLTVSFDTNSGAAGTMDLRANAVSSLTQTTLACRWWIDFCSPTVSATAQ